MNNREEQDNTDKANGLKKLLRLLPYVVPIAFGVGSMALLGGFLLAEKWDREFWSNLLLNFAAEIFGLVLTAWIASVIAKQKLDDLAPWLINLIAQLREDDKIKGNTARGLVMCTVGVLSEDRLRRTRPSLSILTQEQDCRVCQLTAETVDDSEGYKACKHCRLRNDVWVKPG